LRASHGNVDLPSMTLRLSRIRHWAGYLALGPVLDCPGTNILLMIMKKASAKRT